MTLDEFLALPETEPASEFACGRIVPRPMPSLNHSLCSSAFVRVLGNRFVTTAEGVAVDNTRCADEDEDRAYLPDVSVILRARLPTDPETRARGPLRIPPDIAIEVLSPGDRPGRVADKLAFYLRTGVPLTWIVDPEERTLTAYRPGEPPTVHSAPEVIGAEPVLRGLVLDLAELFGVLDI